ncbi:MAG: hypothetical protein OER88_08320 [Planctomycetota bacterium]|nr:hypothetical protein [Planctomycetota bacterium]
MNARLLCSATALAVALGAAHAQHTDMHDARALRDDPAAASAPLAPKLTGLGKHHLPVTTRSEPAQAFVDQGMLLTYGFNHQEALRAFKEAARLDPECAMAYWGWALVLGPNLNLPMDASVAPQAWDAIGRAVALKDGVTPKERMLIEALAKRYAPEEPEDRGALNAAYALAMKGIAAKFPDDPDVATLYAAALMNQSPWNYWNRDGSPREKTPAILAQLEHAMKLDPKHEGALHYYIHAVEPVDPDRGVAAADTLLTLAPGAGHLVHMPSHIYMQVGRYDEAYDANAEASRADEGYIAQCRAQGIYPLGYYPHNVHFQAWAAILQGRSEDALRLSRKVAAKVPADMHGDSWALYQTFLSMPLFTLTRFGRWEEILEEAQPPDQALFWRGAWHYARGLAFVRTGQLDDGARELKLIDAICTSEEATQQIVGFSTTDRVLTIAREVLHGELLAAKGDHDGAIAHLSRAVRIEDGMLYSEPPTWYYPVRHTLAAVLIEAGYPDEAETLYWQELDHHRGNGWSLYGLWQSLKAQGRDDEAAGVRAQFDASWAKADVKLEGSRF